jgi:predicted branched-subunit amino acid permease
LPARWRWTLGAFMTDEVFAVSYAHYQRRAPGETGPYYFLGSGISMYVNWQIWTVAGLLFGSAFPGLQSKGLDFAMVATFIAIIVPQLGVLSFAWNDWPYKLGLLAAVVVGVAVGMLLSMRAKDSTDATRSPAQRPAQRPAEMERAK